MTSSHHQLSTILFLLFLKMSCATTAIADMQKVTTIAMVAESQ
jgi:hypothetical protein